jgi:hypothetical protein
VGQPASSRLNHASAVSATSPLLWMTRGPWPADGRSYCITHHVRADEADELIMDVLARRYVDRFEDRPGFGWRIAHWVVVAEWRLRQPVLNLSNNRSASSAANATAATSVISGNAPPAKSPSAVLPVIATKGVAVAMTDATHFRSHVRRTEAPRTSRADHRLRRQAHSVAVYALTGWMVVGVLVYFVVDASTYPRKPFGNIGILFTDQRLRELSTGSRGDCQCR